MSEFETKSLPAQADVLAPDGSEVRILCGLSRGGMAQFTLRPRRIARAVMHKSVEEIWYFISGQGRMWRKLGIQEETVGVSAGVSITIPTGAHFQFRSDSDEPLVAVGVTMPPWPGEEEARFVEGIWEATV